LTERLNRTSIDELQHRVNIALFKSAGNRQASELLHVLSYTIGLFEGFMQRYERVLTTVEQGSDADDPEIGYILGILGVMQPEIEQRLVRVFNMIVEVTQRIGPSSTRDTQ